LISPSAFTNSGRSAEENQTILKGGFRPEAAIKRTRKTAPKRGSSLWTVQP